jgi:hypothetical protein
MSKIIFKNKKNIIFIYFRVKNTLKNNHNQTFQTGKKKVHLQGNIFQNFYWSIIFAPLFLTENKNENEKD